MPRRAQTAQGADGLVLTPLQVSGGTPGTVSERPLSVACAQVQLCSETLNSAKENITFLPWWMPRVRPGLSRLGFPSE